MTNTSSFARLLNKIALNLSQRLYMVYIIAASISLFIISALYIQTVQMIPASRHFRNLVPKLSYSYLLPQNPTQTIYPDFRGYTVHSCQSLNINYSSPVEAQVLLKFAPDNKHFTFSVTNNSILSLYFVQNNVSYRQNIVVTQDDEFIGDTENLTCHNIACQFTISSVLNIKHDILLTVKSFQISTINCTQIQAIKVHHILHPERNYCSYFVNLNQENYVVFNEIFEQSIWGMQKGNGFDIYRLVKNDDGLNVLTLSLCGISIFVVIGGVGHALIKSIIEKEITE